MKVVVLSTTEGDDKPLKYPAMFRNASVLVINKIDLLPYVDMDLEAMEQNARQINPDLRIFETCRATTGAGLRRLVRWLDQRKLVTAMRERLRLAVRGAVQGVGFRPFVYRLASRRRARRLGSNSPQGVIIEVEGDARALDEFRARL